MVEPGGERIDVHGLQHAILTCVTAGPGLGFNRAALFLAEEEESRLGSAMAIGPATSEEARETWAHLAQRSSSLRELLRRPPEGTPRGGFQRLLDGLTIPLRPLREGEQNPLLQAYWSGEVARITDVSALDGLPAELRQVFSGSEVVCVPLVAEQRSLGLIIADNAFSRRPIDDAQVQLLQILALLAALALDYARLYREAEQQSRQMRHMLDELRVTQEQLLHSERLATVGAVVARVSHEIRNPLTTIGGFARTLVTRPDEPGRVERNARIIVGEVEKLEALLKEMLDFTSPKPPLLEEVDLNRLVPSLVEVYRDSLAAQGIVLETHLEEGLPRVMADADQLRRVLLNLWQNAVQAMQDLGEDRDRRLIIATRRRGDEVSISVSDSGPGISPGAAAHLFTPFFTTKKRGTGLGLAVVKKVVDDHHGTVRVESEPGAGATFTITLPKRREPCPTS